MRTCWASCIGNCSGGKSGEHIVSKGLFDGPQVHVRGGPWSLPPAGKTIGLASFTINALCRHHNTLLSNLGIDPAGIGAFRGIDELDVWLSQASNETQERTLEIDGYLLERWFLKTAINFFWLVGQDKQWVGGATPRNPPVDLVSVVYGEEELDYPRGLYSWAGNQLGDKIQLSPQVEFIPFYRKERELVGVLFGFRNLHHLLWFDQAELPWESRRQFYHHMGGQLKHRGWCGKITINW